MAAPNGNDDPPLPLAPVSPALGDAIRGLGNAAGALNSDPNGESQDEYNDFLAINKMIGEAQALVTKYQGVGR
jgi:hypothetical protein